MSERVFSFDVFDTLLTRNVLHPKDVFFLIQSRLNETIPGLNERLSRSFWGVRVWAEFWARREVDREDIELGDIYRIIENLYELDHGWTEALMRIEMDVEASVLVAIDGAAEHLTSRRKEGQIVFISDMYLPQNFIKGILLRSGLAEEGDLLYVSGEYGLTKGSGRLFEKVLADLGIPADHLVHVGDNPVSDFLVPTRMGIRYGYAFGKPLLTESPFIRWREKVKYLFELCQARWQMVHGSHV